MASIAETKDPCSSAKVLAVGLQKKDNAAFRASKWMSQEPVIGTPYPDEVTLWFLSLSTFGFYK
jgi:hypothetical protein